MELWDIWWNRNWAGMKEGVEKMLKSLNIAVSFTAAEQYSVHQIP